MRRRLAVMLATIAAVISALILVAPSASATCTGSPGCDSGWKSTTVYYNGYHTNVNIDIHWTADAYNTRTFYFSGSSCSFTNSCVRLQWEALYYRVHPSGGWVLIATYTPGPSYGSYSYRAFDGWSTPRDFVAAGHDQYGNTVNSPIILN